MVSILRRRHFVPNPVVMHSTGFRAKRRGPLSIHTWYKVCGKLLSVTSYHNDGTTASPNEVAENQVLYQYNSDGNLVDEYQEHQGTVNTATSMYVGYGYDDATAVVNGVTVSPTDYRPTTLQYPITGTASSRVLTYSYGATGSTDDAVNRLESIEDGYGTAASATTSGTLATYGYLGPDTIVTEDYAEPLIGLDYTGGDDSYSGLDQFGRVQDQAWAGYGSNLSAGKLDEYKYGYNAEGKVAWKQNAALDAYNAATSPTNPLYLDETYGYDNLGELTSLTRGKLDATDQILASTQNFMQNWTLDDLGNWSRFQEGTTPGNLTLDQKRTPTAANEIQSFTTYVGAPWATPAYDAAGNMTTTPQPGHETVALTCKYDAWNRLTEVTYGTSIDISYSYDGLGRMITRTDNKAVSGTAATTDYYYAGQQMLESDQRPPTSLNNGATRTSEQYVWSARYVDSPIESDTTVSTYSAASGGSWTAATPDRLYYLTDANNNVTAVVGYDTAKSAWEVEERYSYDAYGNVTMYNGPTSAGGDWSNPHTVSSQGTTRLFAGEQQDATTGLYYVRARWYDSSTGGYITQDPAQSDPNAYRYTGNDPTNFNDPSGMRSSAGR